MSSPMPPSDKQKGDGEKQIESLWIVRVNPKGRAPAQLAIYREILGKNAQPALHTFFD